MSDPFAQTDLSTDAPAAPQAPRRNVTHIGRPTDIGADVLGHLIDTAARGMPGEWTARWTPGEVRLASAADPRVHILLAPRGTSADVRLRVMQGAAPGEAHFHLARALRDALALHERVNAESVAGARAAGVEPARLLPAPAPGCVQHIDHGVTWTPAALALRARIGAAVGALGGRWTANWDLRSCCLIREDSAQARETLVAVSLIHDVVRVSRSDLLEEPAEPCFAALADALRVQGARQEAA